MQKLHLFSHMQY